jgi:hypothetical protein
MKAQLALSTAGAIKSIGPMPVAIAVAAGTGNSRPDDNQAARH